VANTSATEALPVRDAHTLSIATNAVVFRFLDARALLLIEL
jgi:hypothetical protein